MKLENSLSMVLPSGQSLYRVFCHFEMSIARIYIYTNRDKNLAKSRIVLTRLLNSHKSFLAGLFLFPFKKWLITDNDRIS